MMLWNALSVTRPLEVQLARCNRNEQRSRYHNVPSAKFLVPSSTDEHLWIVLNQVVVKSYEKWRLSFCAMILKAIENRKQSQIMMKLHDKPYSGVLQECPVEQTPSRIGHTRRAFPPCVCADDLQSYSSEQTLYRSLHMQKAYDQSGDVGAVSSRSSEWTSSRIRHTCKV